MKTEKDDVLDSGVHYAVQDAFKRSAQRAAKKTRGYALGLGAQDIPWSRGESVQLTEFPDFYIGHVNEGLGTKNLIADDVESVTGRCYYDAIAETTVASIVNDLITSGASPFSVHMHCAVGSVEWFRDPTMTQKLITGWQEACRKAGCKWDGGETAILKGIILPGKAALSGSAVGIIRPKERAIWPAIKTGDAIVLFESPGTDANGSTVIRDFVATLPKGYRTPVENARTFGDLLMTPAIIYAPIVEHCLDANIDIHYAVNITGHGWRKLMRARRRYTYVIDTLPPPLPLFQFLKIHGMSDRMLYATFTMGAGFALFVPSHEVKRVITIANRWGIGAWRCGYVEGKSKRKNLIIEPLNLAFHEHTLDIR